MTNQELLKKFNEWADKRIREIVRPNGWSNGARFGYLQSKMKLASLIKEAEEKEG